MPRSGLLDYMVVLLLIFWGIPIWFSVVAVPVYIPINSEQGFPFLHILINTIFVVVLLIIAILTDITSHGDTLLWFWFLFPWWLVMLGIFSGSIDHLYIFFGKMSIQVFCPFLIFLTLISVFFVYFGIDPLSDILFANIHFYWVGCLSILLIVYFTVQSFLVWCSFIYLFLFLIPLPE